MTKHPQETIVSPKRPGESGFDTTLLRPQCLQNIPRNPQFSQRTSWWPRFHQKASRAHFFRQNSPWRPGIRQAGQGHPCFSKTRPEEHCLTKARHGEQGYYYTYPGHGFQQSTPSKLWIRQNTTKWHDLPQNSSARLGFRQYRPGKPCLQTRSGTPGFSKLRPGDPL